MSVTASLPYRPLGMITTMLEDAGFLVTHCYEDLIFIEYNAFLIQMGEKGEELRLWFNSDSEEDKRKEILEILLRQAGEFKIENSGTYSLVPDPDTKTLQIEFSPEEQ